MHTTNILTDATQVCQEGEESWVSITSVLSPAEAPPGLRNRDGQPFLTVGSPRNWAIFAGVVLLGALFLGFVHIVRDDSGLPVTMVSKEHFTYSLTFPSVSDIIDRYNERSVGQAMRGNALLEHLVEELSHKGIISEKKRTRSDIQERLKRDLPDE